MRHFSLLAMAFTSILLSSPAVAVVTMAAFPSVAFDAEPLTAAERAAFLAELQPLLDRLAALRAAPNVSPDRWADAQIFVKGVVWALDFGPVSDAASRALVRKCLDRARERIDALAAGRHPWAERRGRSVRGFISAVDGSVQPYGLIVPNGYDPAKPMRLDVVLHGSRNATGIGELQFIDANDAADTVTAAPSVPFIEVSPMGRLGENAYRFEGETDVDEAIDAVSRDYNIDRSRIVLRGQSLGGVGTWQLGLKRPDRFVAIGPSSGPVDTYEFANSPWKHFVRLAPLTPWQETMLHLVDAIDYTANAGMVPVVAAMGDKDPYFSSHLLIEKAFAKEGIPFTGLVDHGAGHSITAAVMKQQLKRLGEIAERGPDPFPKHIRFVTWTLKFSRCHWIEVLGLAAHYQRAEIDARIDGNGSITLADPQNITRFAVYPPAVPGEAFYQLWGGFSPETIGWDAGVETWAREVQRWGGAHVIKDHWQRAKDLHVDYVLCNVLEDQTPLLNMFHDRANSVIWWSNVFFTFYSNWCHTIEERKAIYDRFIRALSERAGEMLIYGNDYNNIAINAIPASEYSAVYFQTEDDYLEPRKIVTAGGAP